MATYFHGNSDIHGGGGADGLQTLVLMNPGYIQYSDTPRPQHGGNLVFLNSAAAAVAATAGNNSLLSHVPSHGQQFVGIPLSTATDQSMHGHHDVSSAAVATMHGFVQRGHYNLWNTIDPNNGARDATRATQGLSLSLPAMSGDDVRVSGGSPSSASGITNVGVGVSGIQSVLLSSKYLKATQELLEEVVNVSNNNGVNKGDTNNEQKIKKSIEKNKVVGESSHASDGEGSGGKHGSELSPTERQEIQMKKAKLIAMFDEVEQRYRQYHNHMQIVISSFEQVGGIGSARTYTSLALKTISKQFRCLKECITGQIKAANKSLLGSGEDNNDDYNNNCFVVGGNKVIEGGGVGGVGSRLKYVDHHLRQQRAIQQLGMIHHHHPHNAWRPQRGLPERSVSVLRAWLFEHFLHPYPKDSDKHMLAKQTGLTRSQVSNWFINARVRLWKPMVEEMYLEEMKDHEMNNNDGSEDKSSKNSEDPAMKTSSTTQEKGPNNSETEHRSFNSKQDVSPIVSVSTQLSTSLPQVVGNLRNNNNSGFSFNIGSSSELDGITQGSPKKPRNNNNDEIMHNNSIISIDMKPNNIDPNSDQLSMKFGDDDNDDHDHDHDHRQGRDSTNGYSFIGNQTNFISGFGQYPIEEITRFDVAEQFTTPPTRFSSGNSNNNNNNVSLTLGLPHCETISGTHQTFLQNQNIQLGMRLEMSETSEFGASSAAFESINNMQNPKRFAAQLLPDFVA